MILGDYGLAASLTLSVRRLGETKMQRWDNWLPSWRQHPYHQSKYGIVRTGRISGVYWKEIPIHQSLLSRARTWMWRILYQWFLRYVFSWPLFPWLLWWLVLLGENRGCSKTCIRNCRVWGRSDCESHRWRFGRLCGRTWRWRYFLFIPWVQSCTRLTKKVEI